MKRVGCVLFAALLGLVSAQDGTQFCGAGTSFNERTRMCEVYYPGSEPQVLMVDDHMLFYTRNGKRIGYKFGNLEVVYFDELAKTQDQIASAIALAYQQGKDVGKLQCQMDFQVQNSTLQTALSQYIPRTEYLEKSSINSQMLRDAISAGILTEMNGRMNDTRALQDSFRSEINNVRSVYDGVIKALDDRVTVLAQKQAASSGSAPEPPTYWVDNQVGNDLAPLTRLPANLFPLTVKIYGVGFDKYYHPGLKESLYCRYTNVEGKAPVNITTAGNVVLADNRFYHVECPSPGLEIRIATTYKLTLLNFDGVTEIPFKGSTNKNMIQFDYFWSAIDVSTTRAIFSGSGFAPTQTVKGYICVFNGKTVDGVSPRVVEVTTGKVSADQLTMDCGTTPTGFQVVGGNSTFTIDIFEMTANNTKGPKIPAVVLADGTSASNVAVITTCFNGIKDGDETDVDCGGSFCAARCNEAKACTKNSDCIGNRFCVTNKCWPGDGVSSSTYAETCKSILKYYPNSASGIYWIRGINFVLPSAIRVQCHMDKNREGGGWTMVLKSWYDTSGSNACTGTLCGPGPIGVVDDALTIKGNRYKLDDDVIRRAIIGSTNNFDVMGDQAGWNSYYSTGNYEYIVMLGYTGVWYFDRLMDQSSTTVTMRSYRIADNYMAWEGELQCGVPGGASGAGRGISCYNVVRGPNPQGCAGCRVCMGNQSNVGWHHIYMFESNSDSYIYICNGPQHSSSYNMNHRWWIRDRL